MDASLDTETLRLFLDQAPTALAMFDREMRYLAVSQRWLDDYGLAGRNLVGHSHYEIFPEIPGTWKEVHRRGLAGEVVRADADRFQRQDGSIQYLRWEVHPWRRPEGGVGGIIIFTEDITQRTQRAHAEVAARKQLEAALDSMQDAVFISDAEGRFIEFNDAFATFHKFASKAECAKTFAEYPAILEVFLPGGEPAPVSQWAVPRALRGETVAGAEYSLRRKDTGESWVGSYSFGPIRDPEGAIVGSVVVGRDITEAKRMAEELRMLNAHLERRVAERTVELEAANRELDSFAYAVSHDLRAPLRAMGGFSRALVEDFGATIPLEAFHFLEQIELASRRMGGLIDGILTLSRCTRGQLNRDLVDVSTLCSALIKELDQVEPGREVVAEIEPGLQARGDARMIEVLLRNLLGNAWKYSSHRSEARIRVYPEDSGGQHWICVADNGAGFDMAYAGHLFQPFQRLHRQDEFPGMGIGLATARRIVDRHGGRIQAQAEPGAGATFMFTLPEQP
jgi:PAS domain S-box-containing protein